MPRILYAGVYERDYARNRLIVRALRDAGARVEEAHVAVFERRRDKSAVGLIGLAALGVRLAWAYTRLVPSVALRLLRCDALAVGYIGQLDMLVLAPLARALGRPVIFNPLVTLSDTLVEDRALARAGTFVARVIVALDRAALRLADDVLVDTEANGWRLRQRFGLAPGRLTVVAVGADDTFAPLGKASGRAVDAPLDVLFIGKFIPLHGVETIVRAVALLRARGAPLRVELVGTGQTYRAARAQAVALGLGEDALIWTDWIPFEALSDRLRRADVALGIFGSGTKAARVIPNKLWQSLACGVASVTRSSPAVAGVLCDAENVLLVPPADPLALADAIERLRDPALRARIAAGGRSAYERHASRGALAAQVAPVVARLANGQG